MATETLLAKTKDNHVIAFTLNYANPAEQRRLKMECERLCENINYYDFNSSMLHSPQIVFDKPNTDFINREIIGFHYRKNAGGFVNGMATNDFSTSVMQSNTLHFDYSMPDSSFSEMMRSNSPFGFLPRRFMPTRQAGENARRRRAASRPMSPVPSSAIRLP